MSFTMKCCNGRVRYLFSAISISMGSTSISGKLSFTSSTIRTASPVIAQDSFPSLYAITYNRILAFNRRTCRTIVDEPTWNGKTSCFKASLSIGEMSITPLISFTDIYALSGYDLCKKFAMEHLNTYTYSHHWENLICNVLAHLSQCLHQ